MPGRSRPSPGRVLRGSSRPIDARFLSVCWSDNGESRMFAACLGLRLVARRNGHKCFGERRRVCRCCRSVICRIDWVGSNERSAAHGRSSTRPRSDQSRANHVAPGDHPPLSMMTAKPIASVPAPGPSSLRRAPKA